MDEKKINISLESLSKKDFDNALKLDNQICFPLYAASRKIISQYTPLLKELGLTYTQYITFMVLWEKPVISVGELSDKLFLDSGTLTPLLKKLEGEKYIKRYRNKDDERITMIKLLDKGCELKEKVKHIPFEVASYSNISIEEGQELYRVLYKILGIEL